MKKNPDKVLAGQARWKGVKKKDLKAHIDIMTKNRLAKHAEDKRLLAEIRGEK